jgi:hypothetical protein
LQYEIDWSYSNERYAKGDTFFLTILLPRFYKKLSTKHT